jgi:hypothetical protein
MALHQRDDLGMTPKARNPQVAVAARTQRDWFDELPQALSRAVDAYRLQETRDWQPMAELSSQTIYDGIRVFPNDAVFDGQDFIAPASVHVTLQFDPSSDDAVIFDDSYPARVFFSIEGSNTSSRKVVVRRIEVDNSSFYE